MEVYRHLTTGTKGPVRFGGVTGEGRDETDSSELQVRGTHRPRRAGSGVPSGRRPRAVPVLPDIDRHGNDEAGRGQDVHGGQGAGTARSGAQGA